MGKFEIESIVIEMLPVGLDFPRDLEEGPGVGPIGGMVGTIWRQGSNIRIEYTVSPTKTEVK